MRCDLLKVVRDYVYIKWNHVYTEAMIPQWRKYATPKLRRTVDAVRKRYKVVVLVHRDPRDR